MTPFYHDHWLTIYEGHAARVLAELPSASVHMAVTSPPYWGLRDYDTPPVIWSDGWLGQLGLEPSPQQYAEHLVETFRELRRVLRDDGTFWLNLGDSYASFRDQKQVPQTLDGGKDRSLPTEIGTATNRNPATLRAAGLKHKDLVGIPWRVAFALQADGWYLRSDIVWSKPNVMPESVTDRPTKSHEYLFLFAKSATYYYDEFAIREPLISSAEDYLRAGKSVREHHAYGEIAGRPLGERSFATVPEGRNKRTVWTVPSQPYGGAHYAPFPPKLVEPAILAGTSERGVCPDCGAPLRRVVTTERSYDHTTTEIGKQQEGPYGQQIARPDGHDIRHGVFATRTSEGWERPCHHSGSPIPAAVLDPFAGSGTTGMVAQQHSRRAVLIDLNGDYLRQQLIRNAAIPLGL